MPSRALPLAAAALVVACSGNNNTMGPTQVVGVAVRPTDTTLIVGQQAQLNAAALNAQNDSLPISNFQWSSTAPLVVTVSGGHITAVGPGKAQIWAATSGDSNYATIHVNVSRITITPNPATVESDRGTTQLTAQAFGVSNTPLPAGLPFVWQSSNTTLATVDQTGLVTGLAIGGPVIITAALTGMTDTAKVTVDTPAVATVTVAFSDSSLLPGQGTTAAASLRDKRNGSVAGTVRWSSDNQTVATVDLTSGQVSAVSPGTAHIIATAATNGVQGNALLTVLAPVATVTVSPNTDTLTATDTITLAASLTDGGGHPLTGRVVRWTSAAPATATVDSLSGRVTGVATGSTTITATSEGKSGSATINVAAAWKTISVSPGNVCVVDVLNAFNCGHACAVTTGGAAYCWGDNNAGELGLGTETGPETCAYSNPCSTVPVAVIAPSGQAQPLTFGTISTGLTQTCGITADNLSAYCWGWPGLEVPAFGGPSLMFSSALPGQVIAQVGMGDSFLCVNTGTIGCTGNDADGQYGNDEPPGDTIDAVVGGPFTFTFQTTPGSMTLGDSHACAIMFGTIECWGNDSQGQTGDAAPQSCLPATNGCDTFPVPDTLPTTASPTQRQVFAGGNMTCALQAGSAYCWGDNSSGQYGNGSTVGGPKPTRVPTSVQFKALAVGIGTVCALDVSNATWCWGAAPATATIPTRLSTPAPFVAISVGQGLLCGLDTHGTAYCMGGETGAGLLGNGQQLASSTFVRVLAPTTPGVPLAGARVVKRKTVPVRARVQARRAAASPR
jgi:uncharacterized protein YjdB/alpha-tubulin suppressor-like RCC1 family protein